jgi:hypothetical protein
MPPGSHELADLGDGRTLADSTDGISSPGTTLASDRAADGLENEYPTCKHFGMGYIWESWKWEISAYFLIFTMPLIIVATLYPHAGQPIPEWPFRITINALLSVYSLALKAAIGFLVASCIGQLQWTWFADERPMYDAVLFHQAVQGTWGSIRWLLKHRTRQRLVALGCTIFVLSVAIDPFIQQLVRPGNCQFTAAGPARLPRSNAFTRHDFDFDWSLRDAVKHGLNAGYHYIDADCTTGNCTFIEPYSTLGYCSHCKDVSEKLNFESACYSELHEKISGYHPTTWQDCPVNSSFAITTSLLQPFHLQDPSSGSPHLKTELDVVYACPIQSGDFLAFGTGSMRPPDSYILQKGVPTKMPIDIVFGKSVLSDQHADLITGEKIAGCGGLKNLDNWRCGHYGAATCSFSPCVRTYNATVNNGRLTERLISDTGSLPWGSSLCPENFYMSALLDTDCLSPEERTLARERQIQIDSVERWLPLNNLTLDMLERLPIVGDRKTLGFTKQLLDHQCLYLMSNFLFPLSILFFGELSAGSMQSLTCNTTLWGFRGHPLLESLWNNGDVSMAHIDAVISNVSESITQVLRSHGTPNWSAAALGRFHYNDTCVEVQWYWVTLPAMLALLTLVLLFSVIVTSNAQQKPVWKDSPLVWIIRGVNGYKTGGHNLDIAGEATISDLERTSKQTIISVT